MSYTSDGIIIVGGQTIGFTERQVYVYWDIAPDLRSNRFGFCENPYYVRSTARYIDHVHIQYLYITRWVHVEYDPIPTADRWVYVHYARCEHSERTIYWYPDTKERYVFAEGLLTNTPLLLKYPKYFNWNYIPQVLNPEFRIWSHYPIQEDDITLKITTDQGTIIYINSGTHPDKVEIVPDGEKIYKITFHVDHVFDPGEVVSCFLSLYDVKNNYLKDGMW